MGVRGGGGRGEDYEAPNPWGDYTSAMDAYGSGKQNWAWNSVAGADGAQSGLSTRDPYNLNAIWGGTQYQAGRVSDFSHIPGQELRANQYAAQTRDQLWDEYNRLAQNGQTPAKNPDQLALEFYQQKGGGGRMGYGPGVNTILLGEALRQQFYQQPEVKNAGLAYTPNQELLRQSGEFGAARQKGAETFGVFEKQGDGGNKWLGPLVMAGMAALTGGALAPVLGPMGAGAATGGIFGGVSSGFDPKKTLTAAGMGAIGGGMGGALSDVGITNPIAQKTITGATQNLLRGGNGIDGAVNRAIGSALNMGGNAVWNSLPSGWTSTWSGGNGAPGSLTMGVTDVGGQGGNVDEYGIDWGAYNDLMDIPTSDVGGINWGDGMNDTTSGYDWEDAYNRTMGIPLSDVGGTFDPSEWGGSSGGGIGSLLSKLAGWAGGTIGGKGALSGLPNWLPPALLAGGLLEGKNKNTATTVATNMPGWYTEGAQKALAAADEVAKTGADMIEPLSGNENQGIKLAADSAGGWKPFVDQAGALSGEGAATLRDANATADAAKPYFERGAAQADQANAYLGKAGGYLDEGADLTRQGSRSVTDMDLSGYMNPYLDSVLAPILKRNQIAKAQEQAKLSAQAGMRGAFGTTRQLLDSSLAAERADRTMNEAEATARYGAFNNALTTAQSDLDRQLKGGGQFNTMAGTAGTLAGKALDTGTLLNTSGQGMLNTSTTKTNAGRGMLDAADNYGSLAGTYGTQTTADTSRLMDTGGTVRQVGQNRRNAPLTTLNAYTGALRGTGDAGKVQTTTAPKPSLLGMTTGALTALKGLG